MVLKPLRSNDHCCGDSHLVPKVSCVVCVGGSVGMRRRRQSARRSTGEEEEEEEE